MSEVELPEKVFPDRIGFEGELLGLNLTLELRDEQVLLVRGSNVISIAPGEIRRLIACLAYIEREK